MAAEDRLDFYLPLDRTPESGVTRVHNTACIVQVEGGVRALADEIFGACASFENADSAITIATWPALADRDPFTVSAWVRLAAFPSQRVTIFGGKNAGAQSEWGLSYTADGWQFHLRTDAQNNLEVALQRPPAIDEWYRVTGVCDRVEANLYLHDADGSLLQASKVNAPLGGPLTLAPLRIGKAVEGVAHPGRIARAKLHRRALSPADVDADVERDRLGRPAFHKSHPIDFELHDNQRQPVIAITDRLASEPLKLHIRNTSRQTLELTGAGADTHHFALRFPPGTLSAATLCAAGNATLLHAEEANEWTLRAARQLKGQAEVLLLSYIGKTPTIEPGDKRTIALHGVTAAPGAGARGTRVELVPKNVVYADSRVAITGARSQYLHVSGEVGRKHIPLHAAFVAHDAVPNTGVAHGNDLRLRIFNVSKDTDIHFSSDAERPTRFILSFRVQRPDAVVPEALCEWVSVGAIRGSADEGKFIQPSGEDSEYIIEYPALVLGHNQHLDINLSKVATIDAGEAQVVLKYENVPGYWDGQLICTLPTVGLLNAKVAELQKQLQELSATVLLQLEQNRKRMAYWSAPAPDIGGSIGSIIYKNPELEAPKYALVDVNVYAGDVIDARMTCSAQGTFAHDIRCFPKDAVETVSRKTGFVNQPERIQVAADAVFRANRACSLSLFVQLTGTYPPASRCFHFEVTCLRLIVGVSPGQS